MIWVKILWPVLLLLPLMFVFTFTSACLPGVRLLLLYLPNSGQGPAWAIVRATFPAQVPKFHWYFFAQCTLHCDSYAINSALFGFIPTRHLILTQSCPYPTMLCVSPLLHVKNNTKHRLPLSFFIFFIFLIFIFNFFLFSCLSKISLSLSFSLSPTFSYSTFLTIFISIYLFIYSTSQFFNSLICNLLYIQGMSSCPFYVDLSFIPPWLFVVQEEARNENRFHRHKSSIQRFITID